MKTHEVLLHDKDCKICKMGDRVYMWGDKILIAHYDGEKLYLTSSDIWDGPVDRAEIFFEATTISKDVPREKVAQKVLNQFEDDIDDDTREAIDHLRI